MRYTAVFTGTTPKLLHTPNQIAPRLLHAWAIFNSPLQQTRRPMSTSVRNAGDDLLYPALDQPGLRS
jgi:hypothetical protein